MNAVTRFSSLPMAEICGGSAALSAKSNAGSGYSLIGRGYHAWFPMVYAPNGADFRAEYDSTMASIIEEDRATVDMLTNGTRLSFVPPWEKGQALEFEQHVAINEHQEFVEWDGDQKSPANDAIARGSFDVGWTVEVEVPEHGRHKVAAILDHKTGHWVDIQKHLLQLVGYGFAYAAKHGCRFFSVYVHIVREARVVALHFDRENEEGSKLWQRILNAASTNRDEFIVGPHCRDCFERDKCPERMLPPAVLSDKLAPIAKGRDMTPAEVMQVQTAVDAMRDEAKAASEAVSNWVRIRGPIVHNGQRFDGYEVKGRRTAKVADLEKAGHGEFIKQGKPSTRFEWRKDKK